MLTKSAVLLVAMAVCPLLAGAAAPFFSQTDVFREGDNGVHTFRIPALIETQKGVLIAVADARHDSDRDLPGDISLVMRRSFDAGKNWEAAKTIQKVKEGGV